MTTSFDLPRETMLRHQNFVPWRVEGKPRAVTLMPSSRISLPAAPSIAPRGAASAPRLTSVIFSAPARCESGGAFRSKRPHGLKRFQRRGCVVDQRFARSPLGNGLLSSRRPSHSQRASLGAEAREAALDAFRRKSCRTSRPSVCSSDTEMKGYQRLQRALELIRATEKCTVGREVASRAWGEKTYLSAYAAT